MIRKSHTNIVRLLNMAEVENCKRLKPLEPVIHSPKDRTPIKKPRAKCPGQP